MNVTLRVRVRVRVGVRKNEQIQIRKVAVRNFLFSFP